MSTYAIGGGGGILRPTETKYKRIVCPVNKEPNYKVHAGINASQKKKLNDESHIHVVRGITTRTYTIIV